MILTTSRSTIRDKMGVIEIDLRSLTPLTGVHFGTGVITAVRHAAGTTPRPTDILTSIDTISANSLEHALPTVESPSNGGL